MGPVILGPLLFIQERAYGGVDVQQRESMTTGLTSLRHLLESRILVYRLNGGRFQRLNIREMEQPNKVIRLDAEWVDG